MFYALGVHTSILGTTVETLGPLFSIGISKQFRFPTVSVLQRLVVLML